ncbi:hypothetical protein [Tenggerimyces flavus]|uniref:Uncharacterized protein n=1 Tax=Tenggerimyces flavus TaxID=1708749 RepID=A0ABV7YHS5_9ACTN|nr:hypothetical protein [Tenggerimyces flavus]MBM7787892.1 hypothetical protein [Tenggerimyces flavus]
MAIQDSEQLRLVATKCVELVAAGSGRQLDWSAESLTILDEVCAELLAEGPLSEERIDLWFQLVGAYTGEVLIATHGGEWIGHEPPPAAPAVLSLGVTAFPFAVANRVLSGEPHKSLASFVAALPAVAERSRG